MHIRATFANAGLSMFASVMSWMSSAHILLSLLGSLVAVVAGVCAILNYRASTRKTELDIDLLLARCRNCNMPEECVFNPAHRPANCKHKHTP